ncbi:MAG: OmpA family protein [Syntrophales bacterium]|jgi:chemotaxis protein MotB
MNRYLRIGIAVLVVGFIVSGCVSTGTYKKMEAMKNNEVSTLQQQNTALENQKKALEQQNTTLQQQIASLEQKTTEMKQQVGSLDQKVGSLQQQKESLLTASQQQQKQYESLVQDLSKEVEKGQLQVKQYQNMLTVELAEKIFFDSGSATLKKGGKEVLKKVGEALKGYENKIIRVVGHTDNVKVAKSLQGRFPTNWELSVARATTVVRYLQDVGIPPQRMVPSGRGEYDPIAPNDTREGRQKNRRIEIMLFDKNLASELSRPSN